MPNIDNIIESNPLSPVCALILYKEPYSHYGHRCALYLETRKIEGGKMKEGRPVTKGFMAKLAKLGEGITEESRIPHGEVPCNLLWMDAENQSYIWYNPPTRREQYFRKKEMDGEYYMPCTVFMVRDKKLYVFAVKGEKPRPESTLLYGPFYNMYSDCHICLGNAKHTMPDYPSFKDYLAHWETLFWQSINEHPIYWDTAEIKEKKGEKKRKPSLEEMVLSCKDSPLDIKLLKSTGHKLKDLYEKNDD